MKRGWGQVWLIGAGPGDEGLITVKGAHLLSQADAVVYDRLANPALLHYASPAAQFIDVGKFAGNHPVPQPEINRMLIHLAQEGKNVARLKGGDPFVFGRGGEEAQALEQAGVPFFVVPGITSAIAAPAYGGIPVTHRDFASSFHVITGHGSADHGLSFLDYEILAKLKGTLVFLMGVSHLPDITHHLTAHGMLPATPAAVIERGTLPEQRKICGTLADIADLAQQNGVQSPAVIVVGAVAGLSQELNWFQGKNKCKTIAVTRSAEQAPELCTLLQMIGFDTVTVPCIKLEHINDDAFHRFLQYQPCEDDWLVFTSPNGVGFFFEKLYQSEFDIRKLLPYHVAAIGSATADKLKKHGICADAVPEEYTSEALGKLLAGKIKGRAFLMRAKQASPELSHILQYAGVSVEEIPLYSIRTPVFTADQARQAVQADCYTFLSPSAVHGFTKLMQGENSCFQKPAFAIGRVTKTALEEKGFTNIITARVSTVQGLADTIREWSETNYDV